MKSTAKGSDLENVSMSASLLKCNQCNAPHIGPAEQIMFAQHVSNVSMGNGWAVPIWIKTFLNWAFCSIQATDLQERESSTRVVGREARLGFCLLIAFNIFFYPFVLFLLSRPVQYSNSSLYSYLCFFMAFKILFAFSYFCFFIALKILFFSHFCFLNLNLISFIIL